MWRWRTLASSDAEQLEQLGADLRVLPQEVERCLSSVAVTRPVGARQQEHDGAGAARVRQVSCPTGSAAREACRRSRCAPGRRCAAGARCRSRRRSRRARRGVEQAAPPAQSDQRWPPRRRRRGRARLASQVRGRASGRRAPAAPATSRGQRVGMASRRLSRTIRAATRRAPCGSRPEGTGSPRHRHARCRGGCRRAARGSGGRSGTPCDACRRSRARCRTPCRGARRSPRPSCCRNSVGLSVGRSIRTVSTAGTSTPSLNRSTEKTT